MAQLDGLASTGIVFLILGVVFLTLGIAQSSPAFWGPGVAFLAVGAACGWQARRQREAR